MFPTKHSSKCTNTTEVEENEELIGQKAIEIARGIELQMAMKSAIELGILDTISEANKHEPYLSAFEVAAKIPGCVNPNAPVILDCMLSLLTSFSVLKCKFGSNVDGEKEEEKVYSLAPVGEYFLNNNKEQGSMGPLLCLYYDKEELNIWSHLNDAIKEGGTIFERAHGMTRFKYAEKDPRLNRVFNDAMSDYTFMVMKRILDVYEGFEGINVLVDVGGGTATSIMLITSKYPNIKGINFDLPHVVAHAPTYPGVESVGGDMFEKVPAGDAIFLKIREMALGLELTRLPFLMVLSSTGLDHERLARAVPEDFLVRVKERGRIHIGWVPQHQIMAYPSVGCYFNHVGFGSVMEAIATDCQLVFLPFKGDQFLNCKLFSLDIKVGVEVNRRDEDGYFSKEDIYESIRKVTLDADKEPGKSIAANLAYWKDLLLNKHFEDKYVLELVNQLKTVVAV